ncbi:hypothetical protein [Kaistella sp. SH11-4b]|nr:hypothetical protein [Kaistella sp. SH11-4b]MDP2453326.1 hypothetical protein [Kaistella sp. SH11-4b]
MSFDVDFSQRIGTIFYLIFILLITIGILYFLIRNPEKVIDLFKLDKNFDNNSISINNFNAKNILHISLFITGGFLIIENSTTLISGLYLVFRKSLDSNFPVEENPAMNLIVPALNLLLGGILITFRKNISDYFEK